MICCRLWQIPRLHCSTHFRRNPKQFIRYHSEVQKSMNGDGDQVSKTLEVDYTKWSPEDLIKRIQVLERQLVDRPAEKKLPKALVKSNSSIQQQSSKAKKVKPFDHARYDTRLIALKIAYLGAPYQGFEFHVGCPTELPTVEEKLFEAFLKARLLVPKAQYKLDENGNQVVDKDDVFQGKGKSDDIPGGVGRWVDFDNWEYTKCGRTDRGVSAFGQVIGIRVRSARKVSTLSKKSDKSQDESSESMVDADDTLEETTFDSIKDEFNYVMILNKLLPSTIRVLAWCPSPPPGFSARFNCKSRTYRYFFTNPPCPPRPSQVNITLDIEKMNEAAKLYEGLHDFRSFCKQDASKQITNFMRKIMSSSIHKAVPAPPAVLFQPMISHNFPAHVPEEPEMYYYELKGSAFLWHQVRHMIAMLFLVAQGLEKPSIITELLDVNKVVSKPHYDMADDRPLVLWDCEFDDREVKWVYPDLAAMHLGVKEDVLGQMWEMWHESNLDRTLYGNLLTLVYEQQLHRGRDDQNGENGRKPKNTQIIVDGTSLPKPIGTYVPIMKRQRMDTIEVINQKYADKKDDEWRARWSAQARSQWQADREADEANE